MTNLYNRNYLKDRRKNLRNNATSAEQKLWDELKHKKTGYKFRRQYSVNNYILDFYCVELKLCIELDGDSHNGVEAVDYDLARDKYLESVGIETLRFFNEEVFDDINKVLERIRKHLPVR